MKTYQRSALTFFSILILGWLTLQLSTNEYPGTGGILLSGLIFGLPFAVINFEEKQKKAKGGILITIFATSSILLGSLAAFFFGPEGPGVEGMKFGLLLGFFCAAPLTLLIYVTYGLSWPIALLAVVLGAVLPALAGFEEASEARVKPQLFACFWLAMVGAIYSWGIKSGSSSPPGDS
ncbi:MAG: hypothetical protein H6556_31890 [Lewinellaceae bacterium]|nr:hypothetical protein [Lewinellaceae bacterium]